MTIDEFNHTSWGFGMVARYHGDEQEYTVIAVDFSEQLIGLDDRNDETDGPSWVRCENVTITGGLPLHPANAERRGCEPTTNSTTKETYED